MMIYYVNVEQELEKDPPYHLKSGNGISPYHLKVSHVPKLNYRCISTDLPIEKLYAQLHSDWLDGTFGSNPELYEWVNKPKKVGNKNINCKKL